MTLPWKGYSIDRSRILLRARLARLITPQPLGFSAIVPAGAWRPDLDLRERGARST